LPKRSGHTPVVLEVVLLVTLLDRTGLAQKGVAPPQPAIPGTSYTLCSLTNGFAESVVFGAVNVSGTFTQGAIPNTSSIVVSPNANAFNYTYSFAGPLNGPSGAGYVVTSQMHGVCDLAGCTPGSTSTGSASLKVTPNTGNGTAVLNFADSGEDFDGTATLVCQAVIPPPPNPQQPCPNVLVNPYPGDMPNAVNPPPAEIPSLDNLAQQMNATATPVYPNGSPYGLAAGAMACGYTNYNWQQLVTKYPTKPGCAFYSFNGSPALLAPPWSDPPQGGYYYPPTASNPNGTVLNPNNFPFYYDQSSGAAGLYALAAHETTNYLSFVDLPGCPALPPGTDMEFSTTLVGVLPNASPPIPNTVPLYTWTWKSTYTGYMQNIGSGGVTVTGVTLNQSPLEQGTGGVTVMSTNGVQLPTPVPSNQVTATASGLAYSRVSQTFNGTVTITNTSSAAISGPLQIVFFNLPATVTLVNATNDLSGTPYVTVPATAGIAPGASVTIAVQFSNPLDAIIGFTPAVYTGSF
jgi:archaellum component FlaF (FlaF/FlaG flagellin family)